MPLQELKSQQESGLVTLPFRYQQGNYYCGPRATSPKIIFYHVQVESPRSRLLFSTFFGPNTFRESSDRHWLEANGVRGQCLYWELRIAAVLSRSSLKAKVLERSPQWLGQTYFSPQPRDMAVCQNLVPLVNIKIAGKWMFIPLKMVSIGIDPYPYGCHSLSIEPPIKKYIWTFWPWGFTNLDPFPERTEFSIVFKCGLQFAGH